MKIMAIKFLGLIITVYTFIILEAEGQNFYPARYGKRDENDAYRSKDLLDARRVGRGENQDFARRKIGFLISGGRFGKRDCEESCYEGDIDSGSREILDVGHNNRQVRSERIRIPIRKNQFMIGSRFGKRKEGRSDYLENVNFRNHRCSFINMSNLLKCLERKDPNKDDNNIESSSSDFLQ